MHIANLILCGACLLITGCGKPAETAPSAAYVQAAHPERGNISEQVGADATLAPLAQAAISPKVTAPVRKFYVQRGSRVSAGQLLATLENKDLEAAALDNQGAYKAAEGAYDIATGATVPEDAVKAQLDLAQATANLNLAQSIVAGGIGRDGELSGQNGALGSFGVDIHHHEGRALVRQFRRGAPAHSAIAADNVVIFEFVDHAFVPPLADGVAEFPFDDGLGHGAHRDE